MTFVLGLVAVVGTICPTALAYMVLRENRRLINLVVSKNPREFQALEHPEDKPERVIVPRLVPPLGDGEKLVGMS